MRSENYEVYNITTCVKRKSDMNYMLTLYSFYYAAKF